MMKHSFPDKVKLFGLPQEDIKDLATVLSLDLLPMTPPQSPHTLHEVLNYFYIINSSCFVLPLSVSTCCSSNWSIIYPTKCHVL